MRLGYELGYEENLVTVTDLKNPDTSQYRPATRLEKLYIRTFGIPDTIKQQQAHEVFSALLDLSFLAVLDIGCDKGQYSIRIARKYSNVKVKGIDINEASLNVGRLAKKKFGLKNLIFEKKDISSDRIDEKYDLVLLLQVIEHLKDDRFALKRIRQITNTKGHLIITAPNSESPTIKWGKHYFHVKGHFRDGYRLEEVAQIIIDAGFKIKQIKCLSGTIGQCIERFETFIKIKLPSVFFAFLYPVLKQLVFFDSVLGAKSRKHTSGIFILATAV